MCGSKYFTVAHVRNAMKCYQGLQDAGGNQALPYCMVVQWVTALCRGHERVVDTAHCIYLSLVTFSAWHPSFAEKIAKLLNMYVPCTARKYSLSHCCSCTGFQYEFLSTQADRNPGTLQRTAASLISKADRHGSIRTGAVLMILVRMEQ